MQPFEYISIKITADFWHYTCLYYSEFKNQSLVKFLTFCHALRIINTEVTWNERDEEKGQDIINIKTIEC